MIAWEPRPVILFTINQRELVEVEPEEKVTIFIFFGDTDTWTKFLPGQSEGGKGDSGTLGTGTEEDKCTPTWSKTGGTWTGTLNSYMRIWQAPKEPGVYSVKVAVKDAAPLVDLGSRDDVDIEATVLINVRTECGDEAMTEEQECCDELRNPRPYEFKVECCSEKGIFSKLIIEDLLDCPHRVPRAGYGPVVSNGCSVPYAATVALTLIRGGRFATPNNPTGPPDMLFANGSSGPCDHHDYCWGTCSGPGDPFGYKTRCNDDFLNRMLAVCNASKFGIFKAECRRWAKVYHFAVTSSYSEDNFYIPGQRNACQCCD